MNTIVLIQPNATDHVIHFNYGHSIIHSGKFDCIAPYPLHPLQSRYYSDPFSLAELGKSKRRIKVLFSGKTLKDMYANVRVKKFFNVIPRLEVLQFILSRFDKRSRLLNKESDKLILEQLLASNDYSNEIIISEVKTNAEDWLKILSKTDFFICPPGAKMPWCHNSVEAMAAGAIPILEYGNLFYPALQNMKNCLSYSNYAELEKAINIALEMDTVEIEAMRKNVLDYYNTYLSIPSITKKINTFSNSTNKELKVAIPFVPTREEKLSIPSK